ncbi:MAG: MBL fold metallo-hydrolase [Lentisphaerae bacterium]|nr:MAG: MBL fold metallo-hydrolase [Lentisphaerota bacterium]
MDLSYFILGSGSKGNASLWSYDGFTIMIDAGFSGRELTRRIEKTGISPQSVEAILVTHEHNDHVTGLRVFADRMGIGAYTNGLTRQRLEYLNKLPREVHLFTNGCIFQLGPFQVEPFSVPHDAADPVGFVLSVADYRIGIVTDLGHAGKMVRHKLRDCNVLLVESNHDVNLLLASSRPDHLKHRIMGRNGHLSNEHCTQLLEEIISPQTNHVILGHLSDECNRPELAFELASDKVHHQLGYRDTIIDVASQSEVLIPQFC